MRWGTRNGTSDAGAQRRLRPWSVVMLAGCGGVLAGSVGFRTWLVVPGGALLAAAVWWSRPRAAAFGGWLATFVAAVGAATAPDGRWIRLLVFAGYALLAALVAWLAASAPERPQRGLLTGAVVVVLVVGVFLPGPDVPVSGTTDEQAEAAGLGPEQVSALDGYLRAQMDALRVPGLAIAVVRGDTPVFVRGYGVGGTDRQPVTPSTPFVMASVSKGFTALAVMQLVEVGDIDLDAPVREYLPWFTVADGEEAAAITVRDLLNQTSGFTTPQGWNLIERERRHSIEEDVRAVAGYELHDPPGTSWQYSNVNFQVAAAVIEAVTGRTYEDYMESEVFAPLEMENTSAGNDDAHASGLVHGYRDWWGVPMPSGTEIIDGAVPMGGISSSAADMANYLVAQMNEGSFADTRVASAASISALHEDVVPTDADDDDPTDFYGLGWFRSVDEHDGTVTLGHSGVAPGFSTGMGIRPAESSTPGADELWGVIVLVNRVGIAQPGPAIADGALDIVTGEDSDPVVGGAAARALVLLALLAVTLVSLAVRAVTNLGRWRSRNRRDHGAGRTARVVLWSLVANVAVPVALLLLPRLADVKWSLVWAYEPGFVVLFWGVALTLLTVGAAKVVAWVVDRRAPSGVAVSAPGVTQAPGGEPGGE